MCVWSTRLLLDRPGQRATLPWSSMTRRWRTGLLPLMLHALQVSDVFVLSPAQTKQMSRGGHINTKGSMKVAPYCCSRERFGEGCFPADSRGREGNDVVYCFSRVVCKLCTQNPSQKLPSSVSRNTLIERCSRNAPFTPRLTAENFAEGFAEGAHTSIQI